MRTGSVGNRNAEDIVKTLPEEKRGPLSSTRKIMLDRGYSEEIEYDAISVEPVLTYSKSENQVIALRYKWEVCASIFLGTYERFDELEKPVKDRLANFQITDDDGNRWLKFGLPEQQDIFLYGLEKLFSDS